MKMFTERADIESKYSKRLQDWHEKWTKLLESSCMYASMKTAALGSIKEAKDRSLIHVDCSMKIHNQTVENIRRNKESSYHKAFVGLKECKEYEEAFAKAQKPWATAFTKVQRTKKNFHSACKQVEIATQNHNTASKDSEVPIDKIKKLEDSVVKSEKNMASMKKKYEEKLARIDPLNSTYETEMKNVYEKWEKDEIRRKDFLQQTLVNYHNAVNIIDDHRLKECFDNQINVAYSGKTQYDVEWYSENLGANMVKPWPKFEEYGSIPERPAQAPVVEPNSIQQNDYATLQSQNSGGSYQELQNAYQPEEEDDSNPFNENENENKDVYEDDDEDWEMPPPVPVPGGGIPVRALYDYSRVEDDELSFKAGDILTKLTEEDQQGWCRGKLNDEEGLYPANYVEPI